MSTYRRDFDETLKKNYELLEKYNEICQQYHQQKT